MSWSRFTRRRTPAGQAARFQIEGLERRLLLSSAIAAFGAQQTFAVGSSPLSLAVSDVNGDWKSDLIVADDISNNVSVLLGNGDGSFHAQRTLAAGANPIFMALADVNGDGKADIITANYNGSTVSVMLGNGNGAFQPSRLTQHYNQTTGETWDTGDFNYDGSVNFSDFTLMTRTYNTSLGSQASPAVASAGASLRPRPRLLVRQRHKPIV